MGYYEVSGLLVCVLCLNESTQRPDITAQFTVDRLWALLRSVGANVCSYIRQNWLIPSIALKDWSMVKVIRLAGLMMDFIMPALQHEL